MAKVLVSDPDPANRALLDAVVRLAGHEPVHVGVAAADIAAVVFEPSAADAVARAAALRRAHPGLPLICVSQRRHAPAGFALRPVAYFVKPVSVSALAAAVRAAVEH